jgi:hypothetical protein
LAGIDLLRTSDGKLDPGSEATLSDLFARLGRASAPRLMLFAHGGLVRQSDAEETAGFLDGPFGYGTLKDEGWETAYLIWRSSVAETVEINREELARDPLFVRIVLRVAAWVERRVGLTKLDRAMFASGDIEAVMAVLDELPEKDAGQVEVDLAGRGDELRKARNAEGLSEEHLLDSDLADELLSDHLFIAATERVGAEVDRLDEEVRDRISAARSLPPRPVRSGRAANPSAYVVAIQAALAGFRVLRRYLAGRDHGIGPTVVEEVSRALYLDACGARAWSLMKQDAPDHFRSGRAGTRLIEKLSRLGESGAPVRVVVIGHSAGSLFASHFAEAAAALPASIRVELIFLAPAIRMSVAANLLDSDDARISGFRMFTMADRLEAANHLDGTGFGRIYRRSLLYLISGILERKGGRAYPDAPLLGLQRHVVPLVSQTEAERAVHKRIESFLRQQADRRIFSATTPDAPSGRRTASTQHGGYYRDTLTLESIIHIARRGLVA